MAAVNGREVADAYDRSAAAWGDGPDRLYGPLAEVFVAACPSVAGSRVLDLGAGTGAVSRAVRSAGGEVVASDLSFAMLRRHAGTRPPAVVADVARLPFADAAFDSVLAGCVLNHLADPVAALREALRVTRPGGTVASATFPNGWNHPAKAAVDEVAARFGYRAPGWYVHLKRGPARSVGGAATLAAVASAAGLTDVRTRQVEVQRAMQHPAEIVAWRLGMANLAPFVAELPAIARRRLEVEALAAVGKRPVPVRARALVVTGRSSRR